MLSRALDPSSLVAARNALLAASALSVVGAAFGLVFGAPMGAIRGAGIWLVAACLIFSSGTLLLLMIRPLDRVAPIAACATAFFGIYLSALAIYAVLDPNSHESLFVGLIWFTPLLAFNKIVNRGRPAVILARFLVAAPLLIIICLWPEITRLFPRPLWPVVIVCGLAHVTSWVLVNVLWRHREAFLGEREQSASSRFAAEILESISECFALVDRAFRVLYLNRSAGAVLGVNPADVLGRMLRESDTTFASPANSGALRAAWSDTGPRQFEIEAGGSFYEVRCTPGAQEMSIYFQDITGRRATLTALRASEQRLAEQAEVLDKANDVIVVRDIAGRVLYWNQTASRLLGVSAADAVGRPIHDVLGVEAERIEESTDKVLADGEWRRIIKQLGAGGRPYVLDSHLTLIRDEAGEPKSILSISTDITAKVEIESRLRQAEQLKAVGQLTGGVAHDFNNLLTVILGNAEALNEALADREDLLALGEMTKHAAERGAALTHRLLAFAQQQALEPRPTEPATLLADSAPLLRQALRDDISLVVKEAAGAWRVMVDPAQLESALLNLCLNARDAMPRGGCLVVEAANVALDQAYADTRPDVTPGDYVAIIVTDDGEGIAPENLGKVFDPFFTTKEFGKGTGLGLSMVYGFIKQSRGHIAIYSEPGEGTSVKLYLPRAVDDPDGDRAPSPRELGEIGGSETILVVEDDVLVRASVERQLAALGYSVLLSANGREALEIIDSGVAIDLLFTDVIMPGGLNGPELAKAARARLPSLRILYTSGYTENAIVHQGRLDAGIQLLNKPYVRAELALKIRSVLGGPS